MTDPARGVRAGVQQRLGSHGEIVARHPILVVERTLLFFTAANVIKNERWTHCFWDAAYELMTTPIIVGVLNHYTQEKQKENKPRCVVGGGERT